MNGRMMTKEEFTSILGEYAIDAPEASKIWSLRPQETVTSNPDVGWINEDSLRYAAQRIQFQRKVQEN